MTQSDQLKSLKLQLRHFGLDPSDWIIHRKTRGLLSVTNKGDRSLSFLGAVDAKSRKPQWRSLALHSL